MSRFDGELAATVAAVVEEGAFDAAARRLRLTPSAVSQRVRLMEEQLGRVLLVRSRPVRATDAGEAILRLARQLSLLEQDAAAALGLTDDGPGLPSSIALAVDADSIATWLLAPLAHAAAELPLDLELLRADPADTARLLESGRVMAVVTSETTPIPGCSASWLGNLGYTAVASPGFVARWLPRGAHADDLAVAPNISFDRQDGLQGEWLSFLGAEQGRSQRHYIPSAHDLLRAVELGMGWAMAPALQVADALASGALVRVASRPLHVPLYWQQWSIRARGLDVLRETIITEARRVLDQPGEAQL